jgi:hypothetical protein
VTYHPFTEGEVVCNIFYPTTDCQTVKGGVNVYLSNGESKIYVPKGDLASLSSMNDISIDDLINESFGEDAFSLLQ